MYTGTRLRRTFDWTLRNIEDDASGYTELIEMKRQLLRRAAAASHTDAMWKLHGSRRIHVSTTAIRAKAMRTVARIVKTPAVERKQRTDVLVSPDTLQHKSKSVRTF